MNSDKTLTLLAVCESCWLIEHSRWEPDSMDSTGSVLMRLLGVDIPDNTSVGSVEVCCLCGGITIAGIFEFRDASRVFFDLDDRFPKFEINGNDFGTDELYG